MNYIPIRQSKSEINTRSYKEARFYDGEIGRFLSIDPLQAMYPSWSAYNYVMGNPVIFIDPTGKSVENATDPQGAQAEKDKEVEKKSGWTENHLRLNEIFGDTHGFNETIKSSESSWGSIYGFDVHQKANLNAIFTNPRFSGDNVRSNYVLGLLNAATVYADSPQFQTGDNSFRHAMRNGNQTVDEARNLADAFVRDRYSSAIMYFNKKDYINAYFNIGVALHTLQDATSPAHGGFQMWSGHESRMDKVGHVIQEFDYPGPDSNLQRTTNWFLESFWSQSTLPKGNLFNNIGTD